MTVCRVVSSNAVNFAKLFVFDVEKVFDAKFLSSILIANGLGSRFSRFFDGKFCHVIPKSQ